MVKEMQGDISTCSRKLKVETPDLTKFGGGYGENGILEPRWWECKMVQPLWKTV